MKGSTQPAVTHATPDAVLDPAGASLRFLIITSFTQSRARSYPLAVEVAKKADAYCDGKICGILTHVACFGRSLEQVSFAIALQQQLRYARNVRRYAGGRLLDDYDADAVLTCYSRANQCADRRAHCMSVEDESIFADDSRASGARFLFPCTYLRDQRFRLYRQHPASAIDQIQAGAVRHGCAWCPCFDPTSFLSC